MVCAPEGNTSITASGMTNTPITIQKIITAPLLIFTLMEPIPQDFIYESLRTAYSTTLKEARDAILSTKKDSLGSANGKTAARSN